MQRETAQAGGGAGAIRHRAEVDAILTGISDGFVSLDDAWRFTHVNAAAERLWGLGAGAVIGRTIFDALGIEPGNPFHANYAESKRAGERVLAVEDNPDVRRVVAAQLAELGYAVIEAAHGEAGLEILKRGEAIDILFTDVVMPGGMTGYELARAARRLCPDLKVLLASGFPKTAAGDEKRPGEFAHLLIKPYRRAELAVKIRQVLDGG